MMGFRTLIPKSEVSSVSIDISDAALKRLAKKGYGTLVSRHEILGMIEEERYELVKAVHGEDILSVKRELIDIAVGCVFAVACINTKTLEEQEIA